ncbi:type II toxin-antitoxin system RelE/ParE family toxin [Mesorhizobium australicum]|uniref:ParE toxin of type II toxin-antitoxin system, parDE n=1 Tax=Mesorhizobium australicum TaxID=536018 RepID=A0A1X7PQC1_9HYPH|nr:type II toxin-antitoxin system RelE/ParE family toxin [Mesorhizobium australicum]SMH53235.1 ParE toxin of type II toxin-antitoxin system, parDE [Mesorhizobium australicum]
MRVVFTPRAIRHLEALHDHLCDEASERIANGYVGRIVSACQKLTLFPQRGTRRDEVLPGLRTVGFERRATIAFLVDGDLVLIEGIFHGGQDFESALRAGEFPPPEEG